MVHSIYGCTDGEDPTQVELTDPVLTLTNFFEQHHQFGIFNGVHRISVYFLVFAKGKNSPFAR